MPQNLLDACFLLFLNACLTFDVMNQQIGRIVQYRLIFVRQNEMWPIRLFILFMSLLERNGEIELKSFQRQLVESKVEDGKNGTELMVLFIELTSSNIVSISLKRLFERNIFVSFCLKLMP